ncbi:MAG: beta-L-arabinofuranosidase domain-containing protein [Bacteroidota bacterium]
MKKTLLLLSSLVVSATFTFSATAQSYLPEFENAKVKVRSVQEPGAYAFPLKDIRLLDSPFQQAMERDAHYLLELEPDRFLVRFRENAGLKPKAKIYGGWEQAGVSGHSLGHYLSACALQYASTGDARFKKKVDYIVDELALCQQLRKTGYVGGIPKEDSIFADIAQGKIHSAGFDLNGGWVPWYTIHKVMAGLLDAYLYGDNVKAKDVVVKFADWTNNLTKKLTEDQMQTMLACEHGGMNDALVNVYAITGDKKYLDVSYRFHHRQVLDALSQRKDQLTGKHANTQLPKIIGCARRFELTNDAKDQTIADFFYQTVLQHYTYVNGGNSNFEHFGEPDKLSNQLSHQTSETCNTYNMLKLNRHLFSLNPQASYADYYERALYNHILASQNKETGMVCYYVPLQMGGKKEFSTPFESFWCCTGSGMENHVKYGESIYYRGKDGSLYVNLFIPSQLNWKEKGVTIRQETRFPESDTTRLFIQSAKTISFPLRIRQPKWISGAMQVRVNGTAIPEVHADANGYVVLTRPWKNGDRVEVVMQKSLYTEAMPDNASRLAVLYGPLVLAGKLGQTITDPVYGVPVLVSNPQDLLASIQPVAAEPLTFRTNHVGKPADVTLVPFHQLYDQHYSVYWDVFSQQGWVERQAAYEAEKKLQREIEERTTDVMRIGEMQPERDHQFKGEKTHAGDAMGRKWRDATDGGWFSFEMKVAADVPHSLYCTYWGSDSGNRVFDIFVNDVKVATQELENNNRNHFIEVPYPIPVNLTKGKQSVVVKIQAHAGKTAGGLFGCRMVKQ